MGINLKAPEFENDDDLKGLVDLSTVNEANRDYELEVRSKAKKLFDTAVTDMLEATDPDILNDILESTVSRLDDIYDASFYRDRDGGRFKRNLIRLYAKRCIDLAATVEIPESLYEDLPENVKVLLKSIIDNFESRKDVLVVNGEKRTFIEIASLLERAHEKMKASNRPMEISEIYLEADHDMDELLEARPHAANHVIKYKTALIRLQRFHANRITGY